MIQIESNNELVVDRKLLVDMIDAIIEGIERGCTRKGIVCQLDLILDKESQKAIERGMQEHREGKTKRFSDVKKLIEYLNK